ncbi:MAG: branched-chain amino acid ABC transporter substrate-binding protein [Pirellulales bacterium]
MGCGSKSDPNTIKIVSSLPRTGSAGDQTQSIVNGIKMALEEVDYKVGNFTIVYGNREDLDDATAAVGQWTPEAETANAQRAVHDPDVIAYIGPYNSGAAQLSMPILNRAPLLQISPANTSVGLTKPSGLKGEPEEYRPTGKPHYVRVVGTDDLQGPLGADWAHKLGVKKVYILDDNEMYGNGVVREFHRRCEKLGIEVLGHDQIDAKSPEFGSVMTKIKALNPDLLYFGGTTQSKGGQIAKDMASAKLDCKLMVPEGCMEFVFIKTAGAENLNDRCYVTFPGPALDETGAGKAFAEKYKAKYKIAPEPYAVYGYECGRVAIAAIKKAGKKDRQAIIDAAFAIDDFGGGTRQLAVRRQRRHDRQATERLSCEGR